MTPTHETTHDVVLWKKFRYLIYRTLLFLDIFFVGAAIVIIIVRCNHFPIATFSFKYSTSIVYSR
jgi:hypothetical protein